METRLLTYFLKIAQTGTISKASHELHVTQPTLSRQLQSLEKELGTPLFKREQHRMVLTKAGVKYQILARQILMMMDRAQQSINQINEEMVGTIAIGCIESNAAALLAKVIQRFHKRFPAVKFEIFDLEAMDIRERLDQGDLDIGIVLQPSETIKYNMYNLNLKDRWGVVISKENPYAEQGYLDYNDLINLPLLLPQSNLVQNEISEILGISVDRLNILGTQSLVTNSLYLAKEQTAFSLCANGAFPFQDDKDLKFIPLLGARPIKQQLIWSKQRKLSDASVSFIDMFRDLDE